MLLWFTSVFLRWWWLTFTITGSIKSTDGTTASTKSWKKMTSLCKPSRWPKDESYVSHFGCCFNTVCLCWCSLQVWGTGGGQWEDEPACVFQGATLQTRRKLHKHHAVWPAFTHHCAQTKPHSRRSLWQDHREDWVRTYFVDNKKTKNCMTVCLQPAWREAGGGTNAEADLKECGSRRCVAAVFQSTVCTQWCDGVKEKDITFEIASVVSLKPLIMEERVLSVFALFPVSDAM